MLGNEVGFPVLQANDCVLWGTLVCRTGRLLGSRTERRSITTTDPPNLRIEFLRFDPRLQQAKGPDAQDPMVCQTVFTSVTAWKARGPENSSPAK